MAGLKDQLGRLQANILVQNGTVLDSVQGEVELDDRDENGQPRKGPVLVLHSIEENALLARYSAPIASRPAICSAAVWKGCAT